MTVFCLNAGEKNLLAVDSIIPKTTIGWQQHVWPKSCILASLVAFVCYKYMKARKQQSCRLFPHAVAPEMAVRVWTWSSKELESAPERLVLHSALTCEDVFSQRRRWWPHLLARLFFFLLSRQQVTMACRSPLHMRWILSPPQSQLCSAAPACPTHTAVKFSLR